MNFANDLLQLCEETLADIQRVSPATTPERKPVSRPPPMAPKKPARPDDKNTQFFKNLSA